VKKNIEVCKKFNLSPSAVSTLWNNKEAILSALENNLTANKKMRKCDLGNVDQALMEWFKAQRNAGFLINGPILKVHAEKFAKQLGHKNFTCNNG
jgi:sensor histidine kinase regulating citrate/malate metabolism